MSGQPAEGADAGSRKATRPALAGLFLLALTALSLPARGEVQLCVEAGAKVFRSEPCAGMPRTAPRPARETAAAQKSAAAGEAALSMVRQLRFADQMPELGFKAAAERGTYRLLVGQAGESAAESLVKRELENLMPAFRERWEQRLAQAYAEHFPAEALLSLRDERDESKHVGALIARQDAVNRSLRPLVAELLEDYVTEALQGAAGKANASR